MNSEMANWGVAHRVQVWKFSVTDANLQDGPKND